MNRVRSTQSNGLHTEPTRPDSAEWTKWEKLCAAARTDATDPKLMAIAAHLLAAAGHRAPLFCQLAAAMARDGIRFESDTARTGAEDIAGVTRQPKTGDATEALERGADDCDAKARLFVALCLAVGVPAAIVGWWQDTAHGAERLAHVSAVVRLGNQTVPVELTLARARLGELGDQVPREKDGSLRLT